MSRDQVILILTREIKRLTHGSGGVEKTKAILACLEKIEALKKGEPLTLADRLEAAKCPK